MQIVEYRGTSAFCEGCGEKRWVDTMLTGQLPVGSWVLVFQNAAREQLSPEQARTIGQALEAVQATLQGDADIDHLFADLVDREPQLPEFLR